MPVTYQAEFKYRTEEDVSLTRTLPDGTTDTSRVNPDELHRLEDQTRTEGLSKERRVLPGSAGDLKHKSMGRQVALQDGQDRLAIACRRRRIASWVFGHLSRYNNANVCGSSIRGH